MGDIASLLSTTLRLTTPILLIALGGLFAMKVNVFNMALEGFALFGCFAAIAGAHFLGSVTAGILIAAVSTMALSLIYALFVLELKVDAVVCAIAFNLICTGITRYMLVPFFGAKGRFVIDGSLSLRGINIPFLGSIPFLGTVLNNQTILAWLALLSVVLIHIMLYKTRFGFNMRVVGLNEDAAGSVGVNVKRTRYIAVLCNGLFCGLAGAQLALSLNMFNTGMTAGRGFTAIAVLIMSGQRPVPTLLVSLLFGFSDAIILRLSGEGMNPQLLSMLPYALALIVAILPLVIRKVSNRRTQKKAQQKHMLQTGNTAGE